MRLSEYIRKRRRELNITQNDLALRLGYTTPQFISNIERRVHDACLPANKIKKLSKIFGCDVNELIEMDVDEYKLRLRAKARRS